MSVILMGITILAYIRCINYGMVDLDDYLYLTLPHDLNDVGEGIWMPLTWLSYRLDRLMFGDWYGGFHLTSILIHAVNTLMVWRLLAELVKEVGKGEGSGRINLLLPWIAAAIWAIHPLRCESVVFLASRKDVLSLFFELLALIFWVKGSQARGRSSLCCTACSVVFFAVGAMCKPSVMTLPLLCGLIDIFVYREVRVLRYVIPIVLMVFLGGFAQWQQACAGATMDATHQPLWGRLLGACAAFGIYLRNAVWPQWLAPQCIKVWPRLPRFWLPGLVLSATWAWMMWRFIQRAEVARHFKDWWVKFCKVGVDPSADRAADGGTRGTANSAFADILVIRFSHLSLVALGVIWFAVAVAPMLGISSFGYHAFADRFTYIPAIGLSIVICALAANSRICGVHSKLILIGGFLVILVLGAVTWHQTGYWKDDKTLFSRTLEVDGWGNTCAHNVLANYYFEFPHDLEKCLEHFEIAESQNKGYVLTSWAVYMVALAEAGRASEIYLKLREFDKAASDYVGKENYERIFTSQGFGLNAAEQLMRSVYKSSKLANWIYEGAIDTAEAFIENELSGPSVETDPLWVFLKWKFYEKKGNLEKAKIYETRLRSGELNRTYTQFRYLRH